MSLTSASHIMKMIRNTKSFENVFEKIKILTLENGNCLAELQVHQEHTNEDGDIHCGYLATLVDNVSIYAQMSHKMGSTKGITVDLHTIYLKKARLGDTIHVDARMLKIENSLAFLEVFVKNMTAAELLAKGEVAISLLPNKS